MSRHFRLTSSTETEYDTRDFPAPYQPRQFSGADDYFEGIEEDKSSPGNGRNSAGATRGPLYQGSPLHSPHHCHPQLDSYPIQYPTEAFQPYEHVRRPRSASIPFVLDSGHDRPSSSASHRVDRVLVEQDSLTSPQGTSFDDDNRMRVAGQQHYVPHPVESPDSPCRRHRPRARTLEGLFFHTRHNRSQSYRGSSSARSDIYDDLENDFFRPRVSTMPNASANPVCSPGEEQHFYLARNFQTNAKGKLVNCGDCYREGSRSNTSVNSSSSNKSSPAAAPPGENGPPLRVMMLGGVGVGKSSLVSQFMSSEFVNAYEYSCDEEEIRPVSVMIDDEEYYLCFIDHPICSDLSHPGSEEDQATEADAYLVVYSTTDAGSFQKAEDLLKKLRQRGDIQNRAVILVANKCDLARSREVSESSGKEVASHYECKYAEISAGLKHNVDELLVGLVTQIKLKAEQQKGDKKEKPNQDRRHSKTSLFLGNRTRLFFDKIFGRGDHVKSKSCDNLQEL